ncbi:hypothetical protein LY56_03419 [Roseinatronobacter thiooxidans]|uniref:Uncharacterized protein n=1 Tax=Roseinatronobacter thiooxidans TaxID=121821 RepID=A0A2W7PKE5_9RHOB|nr:hypothetical protein [Roseinatronobacter thiooxidans]PZX36701.1 hypothetical protein LY56_03419 [Roseinatronobacter thiooxidans]
MPHDHHHHLHGHGHNHPHPDHLHSHMRDPDLAAELQVLSAQFIDGFVQAHDKSSYLRLAGVPFERDGAEGRGSLKLVDVQLTTEWQVGTASPGFGTRQLSYLPFPGEMVSERTNMGFLYVSISEKEVLDLRDFLAIKHLPAA